MTDEHPLVSVRRPVPAASIGGEQEPARRHEAGPRARIKHEDDGVHFHDDFRSGHSILPRSSE